MEALGRWTHLNNETEVSELKPGMDFRLPQYRRAVFMDFYEFHLKYGTHPGCVYFLMPYFIEKYGWGGEERLWFAFINGNTQNPVMSHIIFDQFPDFKNLDIKELNSWFDDAWPNLQWDVDRRYQKKDFVASVEKYRKDTDGEQLEYFKNILTGYEYENFEKAWALVRKEFLGFGRLAAFSYLEYLKIMGIPLDCNNLFLEDMSGSESHRNGLAIVLGRDDLDFHHEKPKYAPGQLQWLKEEAHKLLEEAAERFKNESFIFDVSYFTLESLFCTYKSWHRRSRRYPNVYADMLHDRIRWGERHWPNYDFAPFWDARREVLPEYLRQEDNPCDPGLAPIKQNHYLETGEPIMMSKDFPVYDNEFDRSIWECQKD